MNDVRNDMKYPLLPLEWSKLIWWQFSDDNLEFPDFDNNLDLNIFNNEYILKNLLEINHEQGY